MVQNTPVLPRLSKNQYVTKMSGTAAARSTTKTAQIQNLRERQRTDGPGINGRTSTSGSDVRSIWLVMATGRRRAVRTRRPGAILADCYRVGRRETRRFRVVFTRNLDNEAETAG